MFAEDSNSRPYVLWDWALYPSYHRNEFDINEGCIGSSLELTVITVRLNILPSYPTILLPLILTLIHLQQTKPFI